MARLKSSNRRANVSTDERNPGKSFGAIVAIACFVAAIYFTMAGSFEVGLSCASAGTLAGLLTKLRPEYFSVPGRLWIETGVRIGRFTNPLVIGLTYLLVIVPLGITLRICGRDALNLRPAAKASYWLERPRQSDTQHSFSQQF